MNAYQNKNIYPVTRRNYCHNNYKTTGVCTRI